MPYFYLSFVKPGEGFQGAFITEANSPEEAFEKADNFGSNPGGEVMIIPMRDDAILPAECRDHLLSPRELERIFGTLVKVNETQDRQNFGEFDIVCNACNSK